MVEEKWINLWHNTRVYVVMVPMIVGIHWGWLKLRENPYLVDPYKKRDLGQAFDKLKGFVRGKFTTSISSGPAPPPAPPRE